MATNDGRVESYVGLAKNFKKRFAKHKRSMKEKLPEESTTLSTHFWKEKDSGGEPKISWKVLESNIANFNPVTRSCKLCLREKFNIVLKPHLATINSRHEMFSQCRHMGSKLMGKPPDWTPVTQESIMNNCFSVFLFYIPLYVCLMIGAQVNGSMKLLVTK